MLKRTGTKQRSDDRTTNLSRLIIFDNLRIDLFAWLGAGCGAPCVVVLLPPCWLLGQTKCVVVGKPVNPTSKCGNRHDNIDPSFYYCVNTK